jgi:hypothetical protein
VNEPFSVVSPLTAREAIGKLTASLAESGEYYTTRGGWARWIVKGHASALDVGIRAWEAGAGGRNSWRPEFSGTLADLPQGGSELTGTVGTHPSVFAFSIVWFVIAGLLFLTGTAGAVASGLSAHWRAAGGFLDATGVAVIMTLLFLTMAAIGIRAGQAEGEYVKKWLSEQLNPDHQDDH